ncbi:CcdC protein domain-containing protein [Bacillus sp. S/N-304-OC-R1]|uniref:CcdC protein domain-containing protein n=1 Tax=Bacillus sp. S/N-304-OC-R1 TaxID=2758034 RepID=UPI001C8DF3F1|nr:CcdC protein domain-containing protein [Bacillus sp. S/N-304-OC-R1]MBY0123557.1 cytochrome c biogenesis protein CcdC [Bacillus sp. S/N-304-OC-R1]
MNYNPILYIIILVAAFIFYRQVTSMFKPIKGKGTRIIATLFLLSPGFTLIMNPKADVSPTAMAVALLIGFILSIPLILTTNYERRADGRIYVKKSLPFVILFILLFAIRWSIRGIIDMDPDSRMALFFISACGYLIPWKITSYFKFRVAYSSNSGIPTDNSAL